MKNTLFATRIAVPVIPKDYGPGPNIILTGDENLGYLGQMAMEDFIRSPDLSTLVNNLDGQAITYNNAWLKCIDNGKVLYVAKTPLRKDATWAHLNSRDIVAGKIVTFLGRQFKVRLFTGGNTNPSTAAGGEWDRIMYGLCTARPVGSPVLANFSESELGVGSSQNGRATICQEKTTTGTMVIRGAAGLKHYGGGTNIGSNGDIFGWRPVLELI